MVTFNRGPYFFPVMTTSKFRIDRQPVSVREGTWFVVVPAGWHEITVDDPFGVPLVTTARMVRPGEPHHLRYHFGGWRNRVYDAGGADVTRFGMWSNYVIMLLGLGVLAVMVLCVAGMVILGAS